MDKTLYGLLMGKIKSVSQDFRDLMARQEKQDERITRIESMQAGSGNQNDDVLYFITNEIISGGTAIVDFSSIIDNPDNYFLYPCMPNVSHYFHEYNGVLQLHITNNNDGSINDFFMLIKIENIKQLETELSPA